MNYIVQKNHFVNAQTADHRVHYPVPPHFASDDQVQIGRLCRERPELAASAIVLPSVLPATESNVLCT